VDKGVKEEESSGAKAQMLGEINVRAEALTPLKRRKDFTTEDTESTEEEEGQTGARFIVPLRGGEMLI
jgi:hypothetical protein